MNQGWTYTDRIDRQSAGSTVLDYYTARYRHSVRSVWEERILAGEILLDGKPTCPEMPLKRGQCLTYHRSPWQEPDVPLAFEVLYEDADLLVINKPSGLPVLPGGGFLEHTLIGQLQKRFAKDVPIPIHRLGRGTSGLMLLARSPSIRAILSQQMRDRQIKKVYWAIACGTEMPDSFAIDQPIGKIPHPVLGYLYAASAEGLAAYSEGRVLKRLADRSLVEVTILTGRPHQIRIHLAAIGHPLLGDPLYGVGGIPLPQLATGKVAVPGDCGYWLHAIELGFRHPTTEKWMEFWCDVPDSFKEITTDGHRFSTDGHRWENS